MTEREGGEEWSWEFIRATRLLKVMMAVREGVEPHTSSPSATSAKTSVRTRSVNVLEGKTAVVITSTVLRLTWVSEVVGVELKSGFSVQIRLFLFLSSRCVVQMGVGQFFA